MTDENGVTYHLVRLGPEEDPDAAWAVLRQEMVSVNTVEFVPNDIGDGLFCIRPKTVDTQAPPPALKYTTTPEGGLLRIKAAAGNPSNIVEGTLGGLIESPRNLSQEGSSWIHRGCKVTGNAHVGGDAHVINNSFVSGRCTIMGRAIVANTTVNGDGIDVDGDAQLHGCTLSGNGNIYGKMDECQIILQYDTIHSRVHLSRVTFDDEPGRAPITLHAGKLCRAHLRGNDQLLSVNTHWGTLDFYPRRSGEGLILAASVGCQGPRSAEALLELALEEGLPAVRVGQLRHIIAAAAELGRSFGAVNVDRWTLPS